MIQAKQVEQPKVVIVENSALDAYRRHLQDGSDYLPAYRDYLLRTQRGLSEAVKRRAAENLKRR